MLNHSKDGLEIFDRFIVDTSLPKFKEQMEEAIKSGPGNVSVSGPNETMWNEPSEGWSIESSDGDSNEVVLVAVKKKKKGFGGLFKGLFGKEPEPETISIDDFFTSIKNSKEQLSLVDERMGGYKAALENARRFGQKALEERLLEQIAVIRAETQLFAHGTVNVILEEQVVKFYKECEKGMCLTWAKNFSRPIPHKFLGVKDTLDEVGAFDNYCILHYDANKKAYMKTKAEIEKERDPILFGVIENSRKLYYIGDWTDQYCDLTLDAFFDKFGEEGIKKNDLTAEVDVGLIED